MGFDDTMCDLKVLQTAILTTRLLSPEVVLEIVVTQGAESLITYGLL